VGQAVATKKLSGPCSDEAYIDDKIQ